MQTTIKLKNFDGFDYGRETSYAPFPVCPEAAKEKERHSMVDLMNEVSRELPTWAAGRAFNEGKPIFSAFECALLEHETDKGFVYTLVNLKNGKMVIMSRRSSPLSPSDIPKMVKRIRANNLAGASRFQMDRAVGNSISYTQAAQILNTIFREILPKYKGFTVREEQITLALHVLDTIYHQNTTLAESEVGTGKTLAYLVPAVIAKRGRLNDEKNLSLYPDMAYVDMSKLPIALVTSSIALQKAIVMEYIPELSRILLENGVITTPLTSVIRKGREHHICRRNILKELDNHCNDATRRTLEKLLLPGAEIDLAEISGLEARTKKHICVPGCCYDTCKHRDDCPYLEFRAKAQSYDIDFQVCNQNYLLADTLRRAEGNTGLIPNYSILIIDEAHKFVSGATRSMYSTHLSNKSAPNILNEVCKIEFKRAGYEKVSRRAAKKLSDVSNRLFGILAEQAKCLTDEDGEEHLAIMIDSNAAQCIRNISKITEQLILLLRDEAVCVKAIELLSLIRRKYNADTSSVDLKRLLYVNLDEPTTCGEQEKRVKAQVTQLYRTICNLPKIKKLADLEREQRLNRRSYSNPEQYVLASEKSAVYDSIWRHIQKISNTNSAYGESSEYIVKLICQLQGLHDQAEAFTNADEMVCWLESDENERKLCAIPKDIGAKLYADQWCNGIQTPPSILTSATLSASGDFTRIKRTLGLERLGNRITEITTPSPFNYRENSLLYLCKNVPVPSIQNPSSYINAVTDEIEKLVKISHGRAVILFTSYNVMGRVHAELQRKVLPFPMFKLERSTSNAIEQFKQSGNGVLFASGSLWEGIDIAGDALSMLIIVKLPFEPPNSLLECEREQYDDSRAFLNAVLVPDMLIKLKQGFGRLIRTETDTGVVAILDCRANESGAYHRRVITVLPDCRITSDINDIVPFLREKKSAEYFNKTAKEDNRHDDI